MSWEFVMRTNNLQTIQKAEHIARILGYQFILWYDDVYFLHENGITKTEIKLKDLY